MAALASANHFEFTTQNGGIITCDYSTFSLENLRFSPDGQHARMHPNEDRVVVTPIHVGEGQAEKPRKSVLFTVLDGHDGNLAVDYFESRLPQCLNKQLVTYKVSQDYTKPVVDAFLQVDREFFDGMKSQIDRRRGITRLLQVCGFTVVA